MSWKVQWIVSSHRHEYVKRQKRNLENMTALHYKTWYFSFFTFFIRFVLKVPKSAQNNISILYTYIEFHHTYTLTNIANLHPLRPPPYPPWNTGSTHRKSWRFHPWTRTHNGFPLLFSFFTRKSPVARVCVCACVWMCVDEFILPPRFIITVGV